MSYTTICCEVNGKSVWFSGQRLTSEDTLNYGSPNVMFLKPSHTLCDVAATKRQEWFEWRGASYPANRSAEYLHIYSDTDHHETETKVLLSAVLSPAVALEYINNCAPSKTRYQLKGSKALNLGYFTRRLKHPSLFSKEIFAIVHSSKTRQGRSIAPMFDSRQASDVFARCGYSVDPNYNDIYMGVFTPSNELVGYIIGRRVGEHIQYDEIMGHNDYLNNRIMYLLHYDFLCECLKQEKVPTCLNYGPWYSGTNPFSHEGGLNRWKRRYGFQPAYLVGLCS